MILEKYQTSRVSKQRSKRKILRHIKQATILSATAKVASISSRPMLKVASIFSRTRCVKTRFLLRADMVMMSEVL
jgi:hypothetical protein